MDRIEKLTIKRSLSGTVVKLVVTENGVTVDYSVKTFESGIPEAIETARAGCKRYLKLANNDRRPKVVSGGSVTMSPDRDVARRTELAL